MEKKKSGFGTTSLVLGIIGICTSFVPIINNVSFILGLIGIIFAIISLIKKASKGQAIAGIILCIMTMIITLSVQKALGDGLNEVNTGEYGLTDTKLTVKVTNKTNDKKSFSFHIEAVDSNGSRINEDYIYVNDLSAGQSQNFDIFTLVTSDKIDIMKTATFKVVEASMY